MINLIKWIIFYFIYTTLLHSLSPKQAQQDNQWLSYWSGHMGWSQCARQFNCLVLPCDSMVCKTIQLNCLAEWLSVAARQWVCLAEVITSAKTIGLSCREFLLCQDNPFVLPNAWRCARQSWIVLPILVIVLPCDRLSYLPSNCLSGEFKAW